jgi:23S rRNA (guanosine2251-2'-O)-methyltransferase
MPEIYIILDNVRSAYNVGSILRTADAAGIHTVYCCGTTPMPVDRFGRKRADIAKTALGAEEMVKTVHYADTLACVRDVQKNGVEVVVVEQHERAVPYTTHHITTTTALVFGDEVRGVSADVLNACDVIVDIPMCGKKESLNVSVAVGVVVYGFLEQR